MPRDNDIEMTEGLEIEEPDTSILDQDDEVA